MKRRVLCLMLALLFCSPVFAARAAAPIELDCWYEPTDNQVVVQDVPEAAQLYVAGYQSDGKMLFLAAPDKRSSTTTIPLPTAEFDSLKLFALDKNHIPICAASIPGIPALEGFVSYLEKLEISPRKFAQETISGAELAELLDKLVAYAAPDKLAEWQEMYPVLRASEEPLTRFDAMASLFLAAQYIGGDYTGIKIDPYPVAGTLNHSWDEDYLDWELYGGFGEEFDIGGGVSGYLDGVSYYYNLGRTSICDGEYLFAYDEESNSLRVKDNTTYAEALLAILRSVSAVETIVSVDTSSARTHNSYIITDELIARAQANPVVTSEDHPRWTGFVLGYGYYGEFGTSAREIELSAEWGFNSARLMLHYETLFSADTQTADLAMLVELDKLVAAAIENDIHLNICLSAIPGRKAIPADASTGWESTADLDLFINPEKQAQALRAYKTLAARYKEIPNFNLSITPVWEALNKNLSTGLPEPDYGPEDVAAFTGMAIDAIRAEDSNRLIIYEPTANGTYAAIIEECVPTKAAADSRDNVIISYNAGEAAYIYACMTSTEGAHIDNMNRSLDLQPYPNYIYSVITHIDNDNSLTLNGCLPAGTTFDLYLENSFGGTLDIRADGVSLYSEGLPEQQYTVGERLSRYYPYAESDKRISLTLENDADELVVSCKNGWADLCGIYLTLPDEYARERWYYAQPYDVDLGLEEQVGVARRTSSGVMLAPNNYENGRTITIYDDLTYTSENIWEEASADTVNAFAKGVNEFDGNCVIRFERGTFSGALWSDLKAYYTDLLNSYETYGFSWWSNDWWEITHHTRTIAEAEYIEYAGYEHFNMELLQLLQQYQS